MYSLNLYLEVWWFIDDESSEEEEEETDLQDRDEVDDEEVDNIGYDSEENEIDLNAEGIFNTFLILHSIIFDLKIIDTGTFVGKKQEKLKLADFLEAEAELSESEWGSEDEDEKDLDQMEFEMGDKDKFDEEKVKSDLEKIHMYVFISFFFASVIYLLFWYFTHKFS